MSKPSEGFRHFRHTIEGKPSTKGGITLAFKADKHVQDLTSQDLVVVGFSFCSGKDNFQRAAGRTVAEIRMRSNTMAIPGDQFLKVLRAEDPTDIVVHLDGLDWEQAKAFNKQVQKTIGSC